MTSEIRLAFSQPVIPSSPMKDEEVAKLNFTGWPIPDEYLTEIGRVSALWAALEVLLNLCVGKLLGFNDPNDMRPFTLLWHSSFPQRLDGFASLCNQLRADFPHLANCERVISKLRSAQATRNRFAHNSMHFDVDTGRVSMATASARGKVKTAVANVSVAEIKRASVEINEAFRALYKLVFKRELPPAWVTLARPRGDP